MFDMRYHIASLGAVFLALTVGLLLGSLLVDSGALTKRQAKLMDSINKDVESVLHQNNELAKEVTELKTFQDQVWRAAVKGRLADKRILVVSFASDQEDVFNDISSAVSKAGADSAYMTISIKKEDLGNTDLIKNLSAATNSSITVETFDSYLWQRIADEVSGREPIALLSALSNNDLIKIDDQSVLPVDGSIVLASKVGSENEFDTKMLRALKSTDQSVVAAETSDLDPSRISVFQLASVSTIDNIETVSGWISAIYLLQESSTKANFGIKPTADRLLPQ